MNFWIAITTILLMPIVIFLFSFVTLKIYLKFKEKKEKKTKTIIYKKNELKNNVFIEKINELFELNNLICKISSYKKYLKNDIYFLILDFRENNKKLFELNENINQIFNKNVTIKKTPKNNEYALILNNNNKLKLNIKDYQNQFKNIKNELIINLGIDCFDNLIAFNLEKQPHLLIAGSTGSGKSICLLNILYNLILNNESSNLKFLILDPKKVEFNFFNECNFHYLYDSIKTEKKEIIDSLKNIKKIINERFKLFKKNKVNNINSYNKKIGENGEKLVKIVVVIDELAFLINWKKETIENLIISISALARAAGIFLVVATQRPDSQVVNSKIKINFEARICFSVPSHYDSQTILNKIGAEKLKNSGNFLLKTIENKDLINGNCFFVEKKDFKELKN